MLKFQLKWIVVLLIVLIITAGIIYRYHGSQVPKKDGPINRVVVLGIDGMDAHLVQTWMEEGKLPNLAKLSRTGTFSPLQTTHPAESPVAWATFATGTNPGKTGIFDFLNRQVKTYQPVFAPTTFVPGKTLFNFLPLKKPGYRNNLRVQPFWSHVSENGLKSILLWCPETFPPPAIHGKVLSGMDVPDIKNTHGTFTFYSTEPVPSKRDIPVLHIDFVQNKAQTFLPGPANWLLQDHQEVSVPLLIEKFRDKEVLQITLDGQHQTLSVGQWSDWFEVTFKLNPLVKIRGLVRFYLRSLQPETRLYASPIHLDPRKPYYPISYPGNFARQLVDKVGLFKTLGWKVDTWALNEGYLDERAFLQDAYETLYQQEEIILHLLKTEDYHLFVAVLGVLDRIQHVFWRYIDKNQPEARLPMDPIIAQAINNFYVELDHFIGKVVRHLDSSTILLVVSDHGMTSFRRAINLNTWLWKNGFLRFKTGLDSLPPAGKFFHKVDWFNTKAYALGMSGIYLNVAGREGNGVVWPGKEYESVCEQIRQRLIKWRDYKHGRPVVHQVLSRQEVYQGSEVQHAPDLIVELKPGYRISQVSSLGGFEKQAILDNVRPWSGDHVSVAPERVPGVLFCNRRIINATSPSLLDLAPTILQLLNLPVPSTMEGRSLFQTSSLWQEITHKNGDRKRDGSSLIPNKILLIGLDGADWAMVQRLVRQSKLPHLAQLMQTGVAGPLYSFKPLLSPLLWTSLITGKEPLKHGVLDFLSMDENTGKQIPVSQKARKVRALWNILSERGISVGVVGWLVTWPAEKVNGFMVSDRFTYLDYDPGDGLKTPSQGLVYPDTLFEELRSMMKFINQVSISEITRFFDISAKEYEQRMSKRQEPWWTAISVYAATETLGDISHYLQNKHPVDFLAIYFKGIDSFSHLFAPLVNQKGEQGQKFSRTIEAFYSYQDEVLGRLLKDRDQNTTVIVVSDHGFKLEQAPLSHSEGILGIANREAVQWHRERGLLIMAGPSLKSGMSLENAHLLDIAPTILYLMGMPLARDMPGRVLKEAIKTEFIHKHAFKYIKTYERNIYISNLSKISSRNNEHRILQELESLGYLNPETASSYNNRGNIYMQLGEYEKARACFEKAIELEPEIAVFYDNLGNALTAMGQPSKALFYHRKAMELTPDDSRIYNNLALTYLQLQEYEKARNALELAIQLNPNFAEAYSNLGNVYFQLGQLERAEKWIRKSLQLDPELARSYYNLGILYGHLGKHQAALKAFEKVLKLQPYFVKKDAVYNGMGVAYFHSGDYQQALQQFQQVVHLNPEFPEIYNRLGMTYQALGRILEAREAYQKTLHKDPENVVARTMLEQLENKLDH